MIQELLAYQLMRTKRRTIGLEVTEKGELIVRAPLRASLQDITQLLQDKKAWILRHQQDVQRKLQYGAKQFIAGEKFLFLGEYYPLVVLENSVRPLHFDYAFYISHKSVPKAQQVFQKWYWQQAEQQIAQRVAFYATENSFSYKCVRISNAKRQWGSCSPDNKLAFTWRLIMAPLSVIDYVVVHELVHTVHKNHSQRFWQKVQEIVPDYKRRKKWLRQNDHLLKI